jgi:hypothetical protein
MLETVKKIVPGTQQVQIVPLVTMGMIILTWILATFVIPEDVDVPEEVWGAVTGMLIYALQYWHGPRK